jgi:hypothetical protein
LPWATADASYANCLLIKQDVSGQVGPFEEPCKEPPILTRVYEQISPTAETQVGNCGLEIGPQNGLTVIIAEFLQFSGQTPTYGVPGTTTAPAPFASYLMKTEERTDDGTLQRIKRTYINSGQISLDTEYLRSVDTGTTGVTKTTIKYLSEITVNSNPITQPGGTALLQSSYDNADGYRIWTMVYASGTGTVESSIEYKNNGLLVIYSITALTTPPTAPSPTIGGTVVLIRSSHRNSPRLEEGAIVYDYVWAEGLGLIESSIIVREDGLRDQTYVSLGTKQTPTGAIVRDESEQIDGVTKYTVTARQSAAGGAPSGYSLSYQRYHQFRYPGRLKAYIYTAASGKRFLDVFKSPPVDVDILATVTITYQTTNTISLVGGYPFWQPTDGATIQGDWVGLNNYQANLVESWPGYRAVNSSASITSSASQPNDSVFGNLAYGGTAASISISGGPASPDNNNYTIGVPMLEYVFTDTSGTKYYRQTLVTATIPAQPALPV